MKKRVFAATLWFYAGWCAGVMLAAVFGISDLLGPVIAIAAGGIIAFDPRRVIWSRPLIQPSVQRHAEAA